ncbi:hypothetical protein JGH11_19765 [Dysgonomonas sp. Marseille-P4677]|uniref:hypothetical protein n=1 Tax=Dysgonomonas sp. Marseille-P4677 TaxID=2364790 RepID=UPI0019149A4D|nr:hypothetical protein [Dysgonomonas sp. Marseille-P4677]MBK5723109.1 hypothetical protein [Dysgonomonas sp. Marseille-P4677]
MVSFNNSSDSGGTMGSHFASWYYGSSASSESSMGPILKDECNNDRDCGGGYQVCVSNGNIWPFNKKKCRDMSDQEKACFGKEWGSACQFYRFLSTGAALPVDGTCQRYGEQPLFCATLNGSPAGKSGY